MPHTSLAPTGVRLHKNFRKTVKCLELAPPLGGYWPDLWSSGWNQSLLASQIAQVAAEGANSIKISGSGVNEGTHTYPAESVFRTRRDWFLNQCRSNNLPVYWNIGNEPAQVFGAAGDQGATNIPIIAALAGTLEQDGGDVIMAIDGMDEMDDGGVSTWSTTSVTAKCRSDVSALVQAIRAATKLPLTMSVAVSSPTSMASNPFIDLQYDLGLDFHDVHLYYQNGTYNASGLIPQSSDMVNLENRTKYLGRYIIGEMGCAITAAQALQTTWFNGIGDIMRRPQCMGAVMFTLTNFDTVGGGDDFGMYTIADTAFASPRLGMKTPFHNWIGGPL